MVSLTRIRGARLAVAAACLVLMGSQLAQAQRDVRRIARRDSDDLSKFLIETESRSNSTRSMWDQPTRLDPNRINLPAVVTLLEQFATDAARLYEQLDIASDYNPRLRTVLSDALKLRARSNMVATDARGTRDVRRLAASISDIDSDWRLLSHSIKQLPQVSRGILTIVAALDRSSERIEQEFQIDPQIDRRQLLTQVMAMRADFDNLIDDIALELGNGQQARELIRRIRSVRQQAVYAADLISERGEYGRIVEAYQRAETDWKPVAAELAQVDNRYIERSLRRIITSGNELKKLLWLESDTDISQLVEVADGMRKHVDEFFTRTPLLLILKLDNPKTAIDAANHFHDACEIYSEQVKLGEDQDVLMEVFKDLEVTGRDFVTVFGPLPSRAGQLVLADIRRDLATLQELASSHYMGDGFDRYQATDLAAEMETLAEHVNFDLRHWLRNSNEPSADAIMRISQQFVANTARLHTNLLNRAPRDEIRQQTSKVYDDWRRLSQYLRQAPEEDREHLASISSKLTVALYDLMLPLGL